MVRRFALSVLIAILCILPTESWGRGRGGGGMSGGFGGDWQRWMQQAQTQRKAEESKAKQADAQKKLKERVAALLAEGWANLQAGDNPAAIDSFNDVLELKPEESEARLGMGLARASNSEWPPAIKQLDLASKSAATRRLSTYNLAVLYTRQNLKPRATALLHQYLVTNPKPVDQMVVNAQRTLLSQMDETARKGIGLMPNILRLLADTDITLAATYPSQERFGVAWVPSGYGPQLRKAGKTDLYPAELPYVLPSGEILKSKKSGADAVNALAPEVASGLVREMIASAGLAVPEAMASARKPVGDFAPNAPTTAPSADSAPVAMVPGLGKPGKPLEKPILSRNDPAPLPTDPVPPAATPPVLTPASSSDSPTIATVTTRSAAFCVAPGIFATCARSVQGATTIKIAGNDDLVINAEVLTIDEATGLALLKVSGGNFKPLPLAEQFRNGSAMVACFAKAGLFGPDLDVIHGDLVTVGGKSLLRMAVHPRLPGAPVVDDKGRVVAIVSASREDPLTALPVIAVEKLRAISAGKFTAATAAIDPDDAVVEITVTRKP